MPCAVVLNFLWPWHTITNTFCIWPYTKIWFHISQNSTLFFVWCTLIVSVYAINFFFFSFLNVCCKPLNSWTRKRSQPILWKTLFWRIKETDLKRFGSYKYTDVRWSCRAFSKGQGGEQENFPHCSFIEYQTFKNYKADRGRGDNKIK